MSWGLKAMGKKRKNPFADPEFDLTPEEAEVVKDAYSNLSGLDVPTLVSLLDGLTDEEGMMRFGMLAELVETGMTPEKFTAFYNMYGKLRPMFGDGLPEGKAKKPAVKSKSSKKAKAAKAKGTLVLKIQMKGVSKPPMWREIEIPARMTFEDLHFAIQDLTGLENYHLWQFNKRAYMEDLQIGIPLGKAEFDMGLEYVTDDATETSISAYLAKEGDSLEYVYDFGDDWIFTVTVKKVLDKETEHPVCTGFKSDLNCEEDSGGPWGYQSMRADYEGWNKLSKKAKEQRAEEMMYDTPEDYYESLEDNLFDIEMVNDDLSGIG